MDYAVFSTLKPVTTSTCVAYDVGCQWSRFLWDEQVALLPKHIQPRHIRKEDMSYIIGNMHIHNHMSSCQGPFAGEYREGNGRTFGDGIEHGWADLNGMAPSAMRMGVGGRADYLDDACGHWNRTKLATIGQSS
jgi:hypothetical protein